MKTYEQLLFCHAIDQDIALTAERETHILERHPELRALQLEFYETINLPDFILRKSTGEHMLVKWHQKKFNGKYIVIVVNINPTRNFIITAYLSRKLPNGDLL
jgi:hypothetical protein